MNDQTMEKMKTMKLHGMVLAFCTSLESGNAEKWTADELLSLLIDSEWDERYNRKLNRNVKNARFFDNRKTIIPEKVPWVANS